MIQLGGIRLGHANNSSSTHTLIFDHAHKINRDVDLDYGWGEFALTTVADKQRYVVAQVLHALSDNPVWINRIIIQSLFNYDIGNLGEDTHVDHQSQWSLPYAYGTKDIDPEFVKDLNAFVLQDGLVILGGNDNSDDGKYEKLDGKFTLPMEYDSYNGRSYSRKDAVTGYWTIYNTYTGNKLRFKFENGVVPKGIINPPYPSTPELVDLKITNQCLKGCEFCYQNSTPDGKHMDNNSYYVFNELKRMKVFEVAIGGGEPTLHKNFIYYLEQLRNNGITPSFTTATLDWLKDPSKAIRILNAAGSFAFTPVSDYEVDILNAYLTTLGYDANTQAKVYINIPLGVRTRGINFIMRKASQYHYPVTFLGFKTVGRGETFKIDTKFDILKTVKALQKDGVYNTIGVDSVAMEQYRDILTIEWGVDDKIMVQEEGKFSMYIDGVDMQVGLNSYGSEMVPIKYGVDIGNVYRLLTQDQR